jgi:hypothetical protein
MKFRVLLFVLLFCILLPYAATAIVTNGTLYVSSYPPGATILVDGTGSGVTNGFVSDVPAGIRNVTLTKTGYQDATVFVNVIAGGLKVLAPIIMTRGSGPAGVNGTLYVGSYPTNAEIYINGTLSGVTNGFVRDVPAGTVNLTLTKTGYQDATVFVYVAAGQTKVLAPIPLTRL